MQQPLWTVGFRKSWHGGQPPVNTLALMPEYTGIFTSQLLTECCLAQSQAGHGPHPPYYLWLCFPFLLLWLGSSHTCTPGPAIEPPRAIREVASRVGTVSSSSLCPSLASPKLTEYDQENPEYQLFATCRDHQPLWAPASICTIRVFFR